MEQSPENNSQHVREPPSLSSSSSISDNPSTSQVQGGGSNEEQPQNHQEQQQQAPRVSYRVNISISDVGGREIGDDVWSCIFVLVTFWFFAKGDEYHVFRKKANKHWNFAGSRYEEAKVANSKGERRNAAHLYDQGKIQAKLARAADEKASQDIFKAMNECIENEIEIDLHGQHCKEAVNILKQRLPCGGTHLASIRTLKVITGYGSHSEGKAVLKPSV
ncbi:hypothetical protein SLEP1_g6966 [Rubroshorea leprosula]|nr:hypothetical protein SLEP1_g6966 [Rubroshorea leprosula]